MEVSVGTWHRHGGGQRPCVEVGVGKEWIPGGTRAEVPVHEGDESSHSTEQDLPVCRCVGLPRPRRGNCHPESSTLLP